MISFVDRPCEQFWQVTMVGNALKLAYPRQARQLVVHHCGHVELQHLHILLNDVWGSSVLLVPHQLLVGLHYVCQLVGQVILVGGGKNCMSSQVHAIQHILEACYKGKGYPSKRSLEVFTLPLTHSFSLLPSPSHLIPC